MACLYVLKTSKGTYYIGITDDLDNRMKYQQTGRVKSNKDRLPVTLVFKEFYKTKAEA